MDRHVPRGASAVAAIPAGRPGTADEVARIVAFLASEESSYVTGQSLPLATERLARTDAGHVHYTLKTPYRDGTTHVLFEPLDFIARLAALVPKPRAHLTRYHGVFAPASPYRAGVVPSTHLAGAAAQPAPSNTDRHRAMTWAQRLKRVFSIDIETCRRCGGRLRVLASIEDPAVIERILEHLGRDPQCTDPAHPSRAPPPGL